MGMRKIIDMRKKMDKVANFPQRAMKYQAEVGSYLMTDYMSVAY